MENKFALEWIHGLWMMRDPEIMERYAQMAMKLFAGEEISTSLFGSLKLPDVPGNIALVVMNGPLMKSDVCNAKGTRSLTMEMAAARTNKAIDTVILYSENCPGGQVDGTQNFYDEVAATDKVKPVIGVVSGMACSAAVWALAGCSSVYATSDTDLIGCIGTMGKMRNPKTATDGNYVDIVSDLSPDKNSENKDPEKLKTSILNPFTTIFHNAVKAGRGERLQLDKEDVLSGKTYVAGEALKHGLIDGIMPFSSILDLINEDIQKKSIQQNNTTMKWPKFLGFLNKENVSGFADLKLTEANIDSLETAIAERDTFKGEKERLTGEKSALEEQAAKDKATIDALNADKTTLQAEVTRLGKLDGTRFSSAPAGEKEEPAKEEPINKKYETSFDREMAQMQGMLQK